MKLNFSQKLVNLDGTISEDAPTLAVVAIRALVETLEGDERSTGEDKFKRAALAQRLIPEGEIEVSVEGVAQIKDRVGKAYPPTVVLAVWTALEAS